jgi:transcriptional regulator GlxA family with amidase domain
MTASSAVAGIDMALALIEKLLGAKQARTVATAIGMNVPTDADPQKIHIVQATAPPDDPEHSKTSPHER